MIHLPPNAEAPNAREIQQPLLRWAGSKRSIAKRLSAYWRSDFKRYVEPFCGSCAVLFSVQPDDALLSDINNDLISFYNTIKIAPLEVYRTFSEIDRTADAYYVCRSRYNSINDDVEKAAVFYYLNRNCFNGLFRTNRRGEFNVPFANRRVARYLEEKEFLASCATISSAKFVCGDFAAVIQAHVTAGDFVYLDPPYASSKRLPFKEYYPGCFGLNDLDRLYNLLIEIDKRQAFFVLSYDNGDAIRRIQSRWGGHQYEVRRNISGFAAGRRYTTEQVITNIQISPCFPS